MLKRLGKIVVNNSFTCSEKVMMLRAITLSTFIKYRVGVVFLCVLKKEARSKIMRYRDHGDWYVKTMCSIHLFRIFIEQGQGTVTNADSGKLDGQILLI